MQDNQEQKEPSIEPTVEEFIHTGRYMPAYEIVQRIEDGELREERVPLYSKDGYPIMVEIIEKRVIKPES